MTNFQMYFLPSTLERLPSFSETPCIMYVKFDALFTKTLTLKVCLTQLIFSDGSSLRVFLSTAFLGNFYINKFCYIITKQKGVTQHFLTFFITMFKDKDKNNFCVLNYYLTNILYTVRVWQKFLPNVMQPNRQACIKILHSAQLIEALLLYHRWRNRFYKARLLLGVAMCNVLPNRAGLCTLWAMTVFEAPQNLSKLPQLGFKKIQTLFAYLIKSYKFYIKTNIKRS